MTNWQAEETAQQGDSAQQQNANRKRPLSCDQVAWVEDALARYAETLSVKRVGISRAREAGQLACLLELMEVLGFEFADDAARGNAVAGFGELRAPVRDRLKGDGIVGQGLRCQEMVGGEQCILATGHRHGCRSI